MTTDLKNNLSTIMRGDAFLSGVAVGAVAAQYSIGQLINVDPNKRVGITRIIASASAASQIVFARYATPLTTLRSTKSKLDGAPSVVAELRQENNVSIPATGIQIYVAANLPIILEYEAFPIVLLPGDGYIFCPNMVNTSLTAVIEWFEF